MPAGQSLISESLAKILGMQPGGGDVATAGTEDQSGITLGKSPLSYTDDQFGLGASGQGIVSTLSQNEQAPAAVANPLTAAPDAVVAAPVAAAAAPAVAAAPAAPKLMTLRDYDTWMKELYNQKMYQDYGGNVKFRDPSQGSWTDWLKQYGDRPREAKPVFNIGGLNYGKAGQTTMIDPTTGMAQGTGVRYAGYGAAYRPQTGDYAKDWVITNMVKGGGAAPSLISK
jgi:hypothetical protein